MRYALAILLVVSFSCRQGTTSSTEKKEEGVIAKEYMVVTAHEQASKVGIEVLEKGGNAWDAAVAVKFSLAVVLPRAGNLGGGGFLVTRSAEGEIYALDFREKAPLNAHRDMYLDLDGEVIPRLSLDSALASGVPGSVDGMWTMHQRFGSMPWNELVSPAIQQARNGFRLTKGQAEKLNDYADRILALNDSSTLWWNKSGWQENELVTNENLAKTLERISKDGRDGFYSGETARLILEEMARGNGIISQSDLESYASEWVNPLTSNYKGHRVISMPPPSSGGVALIQLLEGAEQFEVGQMDPGSAERVHLMAELERRVYADRATHLGDSRFADVPIQMLLDEEYIAERNSSIDTHQATPSSDIKEGHVSVIESVETTHFCIVDKEGNAVSLTTTLNDNYGSKHIVDGAGFFLNNEMDDFSVKPGVPNMYGLLGTEANAIQAEKRMLSSMTPTIVEKEGRLYMLLGTPGGSTIITTVFQGIVNVIDLNMSMQESINQARFHHQWLPDRVLHETGKIDKEDSLSLISMGHTLEGREAIGRLKGILIRADGQLEGAGDPRSEDHAMGR